MLNEKAGPKYDYKNKQKHNRNENFEEDRILR